MATVEPQRAQPQEPQPVSPQSAPQAIAPHTAAVPSDVRPPAPEATAPEATAPSSVSKQTVQRAELVTLLASRFGVLATVSDVLDSFGAQSGDIAPATMAQALKQTGLDAEVATLTALKPRVWPALAYMTSGHIVLVLGQEDGVLKIHDRSAPDHTAEVLQAEFAPYFSGTIVRAGKTLEALSRSYVPNLESAHWFWGQFKGYKRQIGEIALGSLVANMLAVAVALFSLQVYDRVIPHQSQATLWVLALGAGVAIALEAVLKLARSRLMDGSGRQIETKVQSLLMDRILGMRSDARPNTPSGLFSAMREFGSVREFFTSTTIGTVADIPFIFLFFALVASIAGPVVFLLIAGAILMVVPGYFFQKRMMQLTKETQGASAQASRLLHEAVFELDTIKSQRGEDRIKRIWDELNLLSSVKSSEQRKLAGLLTFWAQAVQQLTYVGAVVAGTYLVFAGEFTVGTIIATGILTSRTLAPLAQLSGTLARWSNVKTALNGLDVIADSAQDNDPTRSYLRRETITGEFALREVQFRYDADGAPSLDIPGLDLKAGQKIAVLGANGSGKSTFLKLLAGLYAPSQGRVMLDGAEMNQIDPRDVRRNVGYLGQDVRLFAGTLRDNLSLGGLHHGDDHLYCALDFAGLGAFVRSHHRGLDLDIRDGGEGLSVGQRQSIGWARLWLQNPSVCLLDEPTAALDQALEAKLIKRVAGWLENRTAVIATHRMPIVDLTDRVMVFKDGRMVVDGPRDQVTAHLAKVQGKA
ncbi:ATP-binding cassette domain-containing protein [Celeribacter sp.]|uniref:ATP-binding cassette domain-containing protein n=1 Tax=Celeribacter sp. TaxID=1890673 RepID=UPI003A9026F2